MSDQNRRVNRQDLYEEVWLDPMVVVSSRYGMSDVGLAKVCRKLSIPIPGRGYWAQVKSGRVMKKAPLPKVDEAKLPTLYLRRISDEKADAHKADKAQSKEIREAITKIVVPAGLSDPHPLVKAAERRLKQKTGWTDHKGLRSAPKEVLNLSVTPSSLDRALLITDTLVKEMAARGFEVGCGAGGGMTVFEIAGTQVHFELSEYVRRSKHIPTEAEERARKRYWDRRLHHGGSVSEFPHIPDYDYTPSGVLTVTAGSWPAHSWKDTERTPLEQRLGEVVAGFITTAREIRQRNEEARISKERRELAQQRYEDAKARRENEQTQFDCFRADAQKWEEAVRLRGYVRAIEESALQNDAMTQELSKWIVWARAKADWMDPLILVSDPVLDAPEPQPPRMWEL